MTRWSKDNLPQSCKPTKAIPVKTRRCYVCWAQYEGKECKSEYHNSAHPSLTVYHISEAAA